MRRVIIESPLAGGPLSESERVLYGPALKYMQHVVYGEDEPESPAILLRRTINEFGVPYPEPSAARSLMAAVRNKRYARMCMLDALGRGEAPLASHLLYGHPEVLDDLIEADRELGITAGFAWRGAAEATAVYADLGISGGMQRGIEDAAARQSPVEYRTLFDCDYCGNRMQAQYRRTCNMRGGGIQKPPTLHDCEARIPEALRVEVLA